MLIVIIIRYSFNTICTATKVLDQGNIIKDRLKVHLIQTTTNNPIVIIIPIAIIT